MLHIFPYFKHAMPWVKCIDHAQEMWHASAMSHHPREGWVLYKYLLRADFGHSHDTTSKRLHSWNRSKRNKPFQYHIPTVEMIRKKLSMLSRITWLLVRFMHTICLTLFLLEFQILTSLKVFSVTRKCDTEFRLNFSI